MNYVVYYDDVVLNFGLSADICCSRLTEFDDPDSLDVYPVALTLLAVCEVIEDKRPYVGIGIGYYFFDGDDADADDLMGYYCVVGFDQSVRKVISVFVDAKCLWLGSDSDFGDMEVDGFTRTSDCI